MRTFLVSAVVGCAASLAVSLYRVVRALGTVAAAAEREGVAATAVSWKLILVRSVLVGLVTGVAGVLVTRRRR